jgi:hypothetical protein
MGFFLLSSEIIYRQKSYGYNIFVTNHEVNFII